MSKNSDTFSRKVRDNFNQNVMGTGVKIPAGVYRGIVVDTEDPRTQGRIKVQISAFHGTMPVGDAGGNVSADEYLGAIWCRVALPWGGVTQPSAGAAGGSGSNVYGMYGQPPSVNNEVLVAFGGDTTSGIVLGVLPEDQRLQDLPGNGTTKTTATGLTTLGSASAKTATSLTEAPAESSQAERIREQGLELDRLRGQNYSTLNRDATPRVMGMTSPMGHSMVMDDGRLEDGDNLLVRLRTAGGAQILMDDTNGFTYIINRNGSSWIEMNRNGDIDIHCSNSLNIGTPGTINFHAGTDINMQANGNINMKALESINIEATAGPFNIFSGANLNLQADGNGNVLIAGNYRETAKRIDMNGPAAGEAAKPTVTQLTVNTSITESVAIRVPEAEPWNGHLDVSILDQSSPVGNVSSGGGSSSGRAANPGQTGQTGNRDTADYPLAEGTTLVRWAPGKDQRVDPRLITLCEQVCKIFGRPCTIISGYRDPGYNADVKGASGSQHLYGKAIDVVFDGGALSQSEKNRVLSIASSVGYTGLGIYNTSFHFDLRSGSRAAWGPNFSYTGLPTFARPTMDKHLAGGFKNANFG